MQSYQRLTLDREDIKKAVKYWITEYHGLAFATDTGDRVILRNQEPITVILKDDMQ